MADMMDKVEVNDELVDKITKVVTDIYLNTPEGEMVWWSDVFDAVKEVLIKEARNG